MLYPGVEGAEPLPGVEQGTQFPAREPLPHLEADVKGAGAAHASGRDADARDHGEGVVTNNAQPHVAHVGRVPAGHDEVVPIAQRRAARAVVDGDDEIALGPGGVEAHAHRAGRAA